MVSGLASSIRSATESTTFDLAGSDAATIRSVFEDAFSQPLSLDEAMIRLTFVVGGGKLSRQKYDDKATQAVTSTLKRFDYVEDRGASCIPECAGCFKSQHDKGKNVYTVVVFPRVATGAPGGGGKDDENDERDEPLIPTDSPGYKMAVCSQRTFQNILSTHCPTYLEKRECLDCLEGLLQLERAIEKKLMNGHPLDWGEQSFYDDSSDLKEKFAHAQKEAGKHVEDGRLTPDEKAVLVEMNEKKMEALVNEQSSASVAEKLKRALARKRQLQSLSDAVLSEGSASYPPPLRCESQLTALRKKRLPLQALEESSKGRLLTLGETRSLTEKGEIDREIERLEMASCGWFEEEALFRERLQKSRETFESKYARSKRSGGGKTTNKSAGKGDGSSNPVNKWVLPGVKPKSQWGSSSSGKKKLRGMGGAVFSAMMMDSSSDEEEDESDDEESVESDSDEENPFQVIPPPKKQHTAAALKVVASKKGGASSTKKSNIPVATRGDNVASIQNKSTNVSKPADTTGSTPTKKNKNKKKKKNKKKLKPTEQDETMEVSEVREVEDVNNDSRKKAQSTDDTPVSVSSSLLEFWRCFLLPFVMFILSLIASLVTSMFKKKNSNKKGDKKKRG